MDPVAFDNAQMALAQPRQTKLAKGADQAKVHATAKQFEAVFVTQMLSHMFTAIEAEDGLFGGGHAESMFRPMLLDEYGKSIANHGRGIGIADHVSRALLHTQEVQ
jgi:peptidoglycan hydrolase FlgJ